MHWRIHHRWQQCKLYCTQYCSNDYRLLFAYLDDDTTGYVVPSHKKSLKIPKGNQNPKIEEEQKTQWTKEKGQTPIYKTAHIKLTNEIQEPF